MLEKIYNAMDGGSISIGGMIYPVKRAVVDCATSGDNTIVAAVTGKAIRIISGYVVAANAVTARWESGAGGTALSGQMNLAQYGGIVWPPNPYGWAQTAAGALLNLELGGAVSVDGAIQYIEI